LESNTLKTNWSTVGIRSDQEPVREKVQFLQLWTSFWFSPADPVGLHCIRFLAGLLFLFWLLPLANQYQALFSLSGWLDRQAYIEASRIPGGPPVAFGWSLLYLAGNNPILITAFYWGALAVFGLFALGVWPRITGILTWVFVVSFLANPVTQGDADPVLAFFAFYLMLGYVLLGQLDRGQSWFRRLAGPASVWPLRRLAVANSPFEEPGRSYAANLAIRLVQVHFAIVVVASGLHKLQSGDWWAGVAFWYPLHPPFQTTPESIDAEAANANSKLFMLSLAQYIYLGWELTFPFFAWRRRWRPILLGGAVVGWIGAVAIYGAPLFGPVYLLGCLSYVTPTEWRFPTDLGRGIRGVGLGAKDEGLGTRGRGKSYVG
jgi:hypothetical protein